MTRKVSMKVMVLSETDKGVSREGFEFSGEIIAPAGYSPFNNEHLASILLDIEVILNERLSHALGSFSLTKSIKSARTHVSLSEE